MHPSWRMPCMSITRRTLLKASMLSLVGTVVAAAQPYAGEKLVALDWASSETLISLGLNPLGMTERDRFVEAYPEFPEAAAIQDLGAPWEPNLELIESMAPSVIYTSGYTRLIEPQLKTIAELVVSDLHGGRSDQVERCIAFAAALAERFPGRVSANRFTDMKARWNACRGRLTNAAAPPVLCVFLHSNGRFANAFGPNSFAGNVLTHVGLANAWSRPTNENGFDYVGIEALASIDRSHMIVLGNGTGTKRALRGLSGSALWNAIPAVREGRIRIFPEIAMYGALPTAIRFASMLVAAFGGGTNGR